MFIDRLTENGIYLADFRLVRYLFSADCVTSSEAL